MPYFRVLWRTEVVASLLLLLCAAAIGAYYYFTAGVNAVLSARGSAEVMFEYTFFIGIWPVVFFGAPIYAFLKQRRQASSYRIVIVGIAPGIVLCFGDLIMGTFGVAVGFVVALGTHFIVRNWLTTGVDIR